MLSGMKDKVIHEEYNQFSSLSVLSEAIQICGCTLTLISHLDSYADVFRARHAIFLLHDVRGGERLRDKPKGRLRGSLSRSRSSHFSLIHLIHN